MAEAFLWYSEGEISQSKAAEIAGTSRAELIDPPSLASGSTSFGGAGLSHWRIPVVQVTPEELQDEIDRE